MVNDHERCEWVNVSSGTSSPKKSGQRAVKWLLLMMMIFSSSCKLVPHDMPLAVVEVLPC